MGRFATALFLLLGGLSASARGFDPKAFYQARCAVCHGGDGEGRGPGGLRLGPRSFADPRTLGKATDEDLAKVVRDGEGAMPAFRYLLGETEARRLVREAVRPLAGRKHR
ncbi:MAG TPA: cytochrome c [Holophagaceae bacterium]